MKSFLHVGCGRKKKDRTPFAEKPWLEVRLDIDPEVSPDVVGSMIDMAAVDSASVDAVFSSHNIEHLYSHEVPLALAEFRRVLRPDGFVLLTCPDILSVCQRVLTHGLLQPAYQSGMGPISPLDILYGHLQSMAKGNLYMAHRTGFTQQSLSSTFRDAGFNVAVLCRASVFDLWAVASPSLNEQQLRDLVGEFFPK